MFLGLLFVAIFYHPNLLISLLALAKKLAKKNGVHLVVCVYIRRKPPNIHHSYISVLLPQIGGFSLYIDVHQNVTIVT